MNSVNFTVGDKEYALRLTTKSVIALEDRLGRSPLEILLEVDSGKMPRLKDIVIILHTALQALNHGIDIQDAYDIFDKYIEDGNTVFDFIQNTFVELLQQGGLISKSVNNEDDSKN